MRVLIIEDEADLVRALRQVLEEEGYVVDVARDGEIAAHYARGIPYDTVVLDLMLPKRDGWAVLADLRAQGRGTPVLILTARDAVEDKVRGLDAGADDYLTKPFAIDEFLARIRALIRRASGQTTPVLRLGDVEVDTCTSQDDYGGGRRRIRIRYDMRPSGLARIVAAVILGVSVLVGLLNAPAGGGIAGSVLAFGLVAWWRGSRCAAGIAHLADDVAGQMGLVRCTLPLKPYEAMRKDAHDG